MRAHLLNKQFYVVLLLCCILSRVFFSVHYIEDIDSLRFAYSVVDEFNILKLQPHFPGYAVFCFLANILYGIIGNLGIVFSLIGGISTFVIIFYSIKILQIELIVKSIFFTSLFLFFNPMIWIMSNRYMPDLMGLAIFIASFYFLIQKTNKNKIIGYFLFGILLGTRLSYFPLLLVPVLQSFINSKKKLLLIISLLVGVCIWLLPLIWLTGFNNLYFAALKHTFGHFLDYGGTIITEQSFIQRIILLINTIWSDGLGGYWENRSWITLTLSMLLLPLLLQGFSYFKVLNNDNIYIKNLIISILLYLIWILLFQNIIYKSRHVLPIVYSILLILIGSTKYLFTTKRNIKYFILSAIVLLTSIITINLAIQHQRPTAINKISNYLKNYDSSKIIVSTPLINYYLKSQNIQANFLDIEVNSNPINLKSINKDSNVFIIGDFTEKIQNDIIFLDTTFYHNPYVNRMWSSINLFYNKPF